MPKSIKLTDNTFWDSTGVVHNKQLLSEILGNGKLDGIEISDTEPEDESVQFWLDTSEDTPSAITGDTFPIGAVIEWDFETLPNNWLWTDHDYKIADYPELYALCGSTFNISTTPSGYFRTPSRAGLVSVGVGSYTDENGKTKTFELNQKVGEYENTLTIEKIPEHNHPAPSGYDESNWYVMYSEASQGFGTYAGGTYQYTTVSKTIQPQGGNEPHNNTQPSIGVNYIIKARQSAGVVAEVIGRDGEATEENVYSASTINGIVKVLSQQQEKRAQNTANWYVVAEIDSTGYIPSSLTLLIGTSYDYSPNNCVVINAITTYQKSKLTQINSIYENTTIKPLEKVRVVYDNEKFRIEVYYSVNNINSIIVKNESFLDEYTKIITPIIAPTTGTVKDELNISY